MTLLLLLVLLRGGACAQVFASIDFDGDGVLSSSEFSNAVERLELSPPLSSSELRTVMQALDSNGCVTVPPLCLPLPRSCHCEQCFHCAVRVLTACGNCVCLPRVPSAYAYCVCAFCAC